MSVLSPALPAETIRVAGIANQHAAKSLSKERTFAQDVHDATRLRQVLGDQAAAVAKSLQCQGLRGATIALKLRWPDFTPLTWQTTLPEPTNQEAAIAEAALRLFEHTWRPPRPVRLVGVGLSRTAQQTSLWERPEPLQDKRQQVEATLLLLRARFGEEVVQWGHEWKPA